MSRQVSKGCNIPDRNITAHILHRCMHHQSPNLVRFGASVSYGSGVEAIAVETSGDTTVGRKLSNCRMVRDDDGNFQQVCS